MTAPERQRGRLKVFLGYAAGVGKTFRMLTEAHELKAQGVDVVIGYFEPHARKDTIALSEGLEAVPTRTVEYRGARFEEMDTEAVLARHPQLALVDEFPHTNVPGSARQKRWEDVDVLLDAGIDVMTTMNVQHLESLNDQIWQSTGVRVRETIPDWVVKGADDVVMVDVTPRALLNRLARGVIYGHERAQSALQNFFKESTLVALRELAMRQAAHVIESRLPGDDAQGAVKAAERQHAGRAGEVELQPAHGSFLANAGGAEGVGGDHGAAGAKPEGFVFDVAIVEGEGALGGVGGVVFLEVGDELELGLFVEVAVELEAGGAHGEFALHGAQPEADGDPLVAAHGANVLALGDNPEGQRLESFDGFPIDQHAGAVG